MAICGGPLTTAGVTGPTWRVKDIVTMNLRADQYSFWYFGYPTPRAEEGFGLT
jgi:hypothetical protein